VQRMLDLLRELEDKLKHLGDVLRGGTGGDLGPMGAILGPLLDAMVEPVAALADEIGAKLVEILRFDEIAQALHHWGSKVGNPLAPMTVKVTVRHRCPLRIPSLLSVPAMYSYLRHTFYKEGDVTTFGCPLLEISRQVELQSTGGRVDMPPLLPLWKATFWPGDGKDGVDAESDDD